MRTCRTPRFNGVAREQLPQGDQLYSPGEEQSGLRLPMPEHIHERLPRVVAHTASTCDIVILEHIVRSQGHRPCELFLDGYESQA